MADHYSGCLRIPVSFYTDDVKKQLYWCAGENRCDLGTSDGDGIVYIRKDQILWGQFEELEAWLVEHGVPFDRHSGGYCEIEPCLRQYRPAEDGVDAVDVEYMQTVNGETHLSRDDVLPYLELPPEKAVAAIRTLIGRECPVVRPLVDYNSHGIASDQSTESLLSSN